MNKPGRYGEGACPVIIGELGVKVPYSMVVLADACPVTTEGSSFRVGAVGLGAKSATRPCRGGGMSLEHPGPLAEKRIEGLGVPTCTIRIGHLASTIGTCDHYSFRDCSGRERCTYSVRSGRMSCNYRGGSRSAYENQTSLNTSLARGEAAAEKHP